LSYRIKLAVFALGAVIFLFVLDTAYEGIKTLRRLDVVEAERDHWQRPSDILGALNVRPGDTVVDFGSGSGYFALKLSSAVGPSGKVVAVDIRRLSLTFLWVRTLVKHQRNIDVTLVEPDNSNLPSHTANAVLLLNTYHELEKPTPVLDQIFQCLVSGGRLVVVDPLHTEHGELPPTPVEEELRRRGFAIVSRDDQFIDQPAGKPWWLIVARRP
jgi:ubiquinone/menaquinone biosynthesis C-methylase UbiE